jgi:hypothetical protein
MKYILHSIVENLIVPSRDTGEQELLSIIETLHEFRNISLGYKIIVQTDH